MADIDIQEKRGSVWPWILGALALVLVVWAAAEFMGGGDEEFVASEPALEQPLEAPMVTDDASLPMEVTQFEQQCTGSAIAEDMSLSHELTESCVQQLTAALGAVIQRDTVNGTALSQELEQFRTTADQLTQNRESTEHSSYVRQVFEGAASLIANIEESRVAAQPALERRATQVQQAAQAVSADQPVLEQREQVSAFFDEAANALRAMSN